MIFPFKYDRALGRIESLKRFSDDEREEAEDSRLELELSLNRGGKEREVVLLEAISEEALRRTHRRYFENLENLATSDPAKQLAPEE